MKSRPPQCPRCGSPCTVVERVTALLDWGAAIVGCDGVVRPEDPDVMPPYATADTSAGPTVPYGNCGSGACRHQWRLRRCFDPTMPLATLNTEPEGH